MKIIVLGAGPGGYVAALKAAQLGAEVTVVEEDEVGGTCLNYGCIPTKTLLASSEAYVHATHLDSFGIELQGALTPNMQKIIERKNNVVATQVKGIRALFKSWGVELKEGRGAFKSDKEIRVTNKEGAKETLDADKIIIATGSRPAQIPTFPFDGENIISSTDALNLTEIPESMLIIGAGVMGCEFACIYSDLGSKVTLVELMPRAVSTEDPEISQVLERELKKKKIKLVMDVKVEKVSVDNDGVHAFLSNNKELIGQKMLVTIGRTYNSDSLNLNNAGIKAGERGDIQVNEYLETSNSNVYAIGDVTGGMLLAHVASKEGIVAVQNIFGKKNAMDHSVVPAAIFTSPEIASVGLRQDQAEEQGIQFNTGVFQYRGLGKAHAMNEISGLFKIIADKSTDKVLGVHIIGAHASDIIHEGALAMQKGLTVRDIAETIHTHPTLSEGLMEAAEDVHGEAIHAPKPKK